MLEERSEAVREIEKIMEDEYDYTSMRDEATALKFAIENFLRDNDRDELDMKDYRWRLIRPVNRIWNSDKLRTALGKSGYLKVCKVEPDPDKIDNLVREGKLDLSEIEDALEEFPKKPYAKRFENSEAKADAEAERVKAAMS